jgi:hypothetical protein
LCIRASSAATPNIRTPITTHIPTTIVPPTLHHHHHQQQHQHHPFQPLPTSSKHLPTQHSSIRLSISKAVLTIHSPASQSALLRPSFCCSPTFSHADADQTQTSIFARVNPSIHPACPTTREESRSHSLSLESPCPSARAPRRNLTHRRQPLSLTMSPHPRSPSARTTLCRLLRPP